jgi:hypothetical protein
VVLNEYLPHPARDWDGSGEADNRDEYIEIINLDDGPINLKNWKLDDLAGGGSNPYTLPDVTIGPRQILRFFASETGLFLSDGGDSVRLLRPDGSTADSHYYSIVTIFDRAWCRLPDGTGAWAFACRPTPGRPNAIAGSEPAPGSDESPELYDPCPLADTLPPAFHLAECSDFGAGLPGWRMAYESWLPDLWKFRLFVK